MSDPIDALAVGLTQDHRAAQTKRGRGKAKDEAPAAGTADEGNAATDPAASDATTTDVAPSDASAPSSTSGAGEPTPPAPDEDRESVHERRMERLHNLVEEAKFESGTAFGDLRDTVLEIVKHRPKVWSAMDQSEQRDLIRFVEAAAKRILNKVVQVVAEEGAESINATLTPTWAVKGETIEAKVKIDHVDNEILTDLFKLAGHRIVLVSADDARFSGARKPQDGEPDQPEIPFGDDVRQPAPEPTTASQAQPGPAGDEDLTDDDFGVFDPAREEWLADEAGGDEGWTPDVETAGRWPHAKATELAEEFSDEHGTVETRRL